ncbi:phosphoribulokinase [Massilia sp. CCM 8695]|uniref:Phosphoribulokinase n=1 Tax=Massilia frigida TaxID=2609281 RepID=A0ABX0NKH5_9BURK|nr:phosphoribulokinase [Massilia frigida]NHZ84113.1 phosphoribulokinase [Massilia frigida]
MSMMNGMPGGQLDDLEPTLARHGYRLKDMTELFDAKAAEIRAMFSNQLEPKRTAEIRERMLAAGLPICDIICS